MSRLILTASALVVSCFFAGCVQRAVLPEKGGSSSSSSCVKEDWACAVEENEIKMRWGCEDQIKAGLKDPRSYQANDVNYWPSMNPDPALVMVKIDYTATNSFGGPVRGNAVCHADADGNILSSKYL